MNPHTADRIDRYNEYAAKARARATAAFKAGDAHSARFAGGQPILVGHHSEKPARRAQERADADMRRAIKNQDTAKYWEQKAKAAKRREEQKHDPGVIQRRIDRLETERRRITRLLADAETEGNTGYVAQLTERAAEVAEQLAENRAELTESGAKVWGKADFKKGDYVFRDGMWWEIKSANKNTVTVGAVVGFDHARARVDGKRVYRLADNPYSWTDTISYTEITGRMSADDMAARLAA
ncbi:DUF3560 domain-containing protein [Nocardiopsis sp. CT-R113]|uniref:DUF3560 domain-containing protein n=1 Tax=Nocardiopsis codii TaxID=3065942 RepID=A0ABU7KDA7_9ACTN|nr:DUF3560 domain-containing protein [Nocardiopsis sp. CT-R113]MEE2040211.1 DUF3560 domain-containing protein [Nocardiopsis sp. CT-R113]